jgi:hypothetical protein
MFPQDVIDQSIIAYTTRSATTASGYTGAPPAGRFFSPAGDLECLAYQLTRDMRCPGTKETRIINGPWFFKTDVKFVKKIAVRRGWAVEASMELFNLFDTVNFIPNTTTSASSKSGWEVTSAAIDLNASQDPGGRITQFGLRFTW